MGTEDAFTGPVNLGNPQEFTVRQLAEEILAITGSRSTIVHRPLPADDPRQRQPDIALAKTVLGWTPTVSLKEGLERTVGYFDHMLSGTVEELGVASRNAAIA
jgi:UDP-glucuronate decarboxylase